MILTQRPVFVRDFSDVRIPRSANRDSRFFLKVGHRWYEENGLTETWVKHKEFKRFPRAPQELYEDIPPNFHRIWSYCYGRNRCDWTPSPPHPTPLGLVWLEISGLEISGLVSLGWYPGRGENSWTGDLSGESAWRLWTFWTFRRFKQTRTN